MCMNDKMLPFKLSSNGWDEEKSKGHLRKSWPAQMNSLNNELHLQDKVWDVKIIKKSLDKWECEEFKMALRPKSKLHIYTKFKQEVEFENYLKYLKGALSRF